MSDYLPKFPGGQAIGFTVGAGGVVGGQLVTTGGAVCGAASSDVLGVAGYDQVAGGFCTVYRDGVQRLVASGAITQGQLLQTAANGQVATASGTNTVIGRALSTSANGALVDCALYAD